MTDEGPIRRLTTIVAADVAGYSRLTEDDEEATLTVLRAYRRDFIDPKIEEYRGRIANTAGDSVLMEFPSVVEALRCAIDVQEGMKQRNRDVPEERRILLRVGINLGDVIDQDGDLLGDGVNVAARLEGLAEPGGICVSRAARDQVIDKLELAFEDLGEVQVKNISRPVRVFKILLDGADPGESTRPRRRHSASTIASGAVLLVLIAVAAASFVWQPWTGNRGTAGPDRIAQPSSGPPSLAVLPFHNMSDDPRQAYFADGLAEDIITDLSKLSGLLVTSRNSSFAYRGDNIDIRKVGRELGVKYVLEGSVRRSGNTVRINAQLIDTQTSAHLWAERYDGELRDIFALQDKVTRKIIDALTIAINPTEEQSLATGDTEDGEAYDSFLLGVRHLNAVDWNRLEENNRAREHFENAVRTDATFARAQAGLAWTHWYDFVYFNRLGSSKNRAFELASRSIELGDNALARRLIAKTHLQLRAFGGARLVAAREYDQAITEMRRAVALEPGNADTIAELAFTLVFAGELEEAKSLLAKAVRLNPNFPNWYNEPIGMVHYLEGDYEQAVKAFSSWHEGNRSIDVYAPSAHWLTAALAQTGQTEKAGEIQKTLGRFAREKFSTNLLAIRLATPLKKKQHLDSFIAGLRLAGVQEEPE